jgi:parallel beta-helix repeat protein
VTFDGNDVTNDNTAICFVVGSASYGHATGALITRNRIHHCGRLPAWNHDHGIYVEDATGTRITENYIYDNADRGIQFYPNAQDSYAAHNVIDGNGQGVIFAGGDEGQGYVASRNNVVEFNVITNAKLRYNVEAYWDGAPGSGNVARNNCVHGGAQGDVQSPQVGFTANNNLVADPHYVNRAAKDFRLSPDSPCASVLTGAPKPPAAAPAPAQPAKTCRSSRRKRCSRLRLVSLRVRSLGRGRVLLTGKVASSHRRAASRAKVQLERSKRWRTVAKLRVNRRGRFAVRLRSGSVRASSLLRLRAVVRGVGTSRTARVRVKR